jgi:hypothetical protein
MAGLRDGLQRSRELYLPEFDQTHDAAVPKPASGTRSLPQRVRNIGFSVRGEERQSAWKRRVIQRTTTPTETTFRTTLLTRCALLHGLGGVLLAGAMTALFLESRERGWLWLIVLAMLLALSGVTAYWCVEHVDRLGLARWLMLGSDLVVLTCLWVLLGPSLALALLLPGIALLALYLSDRRDMLITAAIEAALLVALLLADLAGLPHQALRVPGALALLLNLFVALGCLAWIVYALLAVLERSEQLGAADHWNSAEIARVRIESDIHLRQLQESVSVLQGVLGRVAAGELHARVAMREGELAPVAAKLNSLLDRQEQMFDEARQHRRLEAAVGELIAMLEALHRGERVGWPPPTGTQVDRILALMRAPLPPRPLLRTTGKLPAPPSDLEQAPEALPPKAQEAGHHPEDEAMSAAVAPGTIPHAEGS